MPEMMQYEILRACWLSGQIDDAHMQEIMQRDPDFLEWMIERALTEAQARDADAILSDLEQSVCRDCMGVGSLCWCCGEADQP